MSFKSLFKSATSLVVNVGANVTGEENMPITFAPAEDRTCNPPHANPTFHRVTLTQDSTSALYT